ncbi:hypothetical protein ACIPZ5_24855 [Pseudomonas sp. NPDC089428]|uniref:hypothetical protein n=1 Tax=Pseudomonas sp. NPDC089428 TaxID=3364467 RepID=UPI0038258AE5
MARPTRAQFRKYMDQGPCTFGWHAVLVLDRWRTNAILAQEHLEFLIGGEWLPLITLKTDRDNGTWREIENMQLDRPVLSFANADLGMSKARLSMNVLGGILREYRQVPGSSQPELVEYSFMDPLSAPKLRMDILLKETGDGFVSEEGAVVFDLSNGTGYTFEATGWEEMNQKLGAALQKYFKEIWPKDKQVWELNVLKPVEGQLNPVRFRVRTHPLVGAMELSQVSAEEIPEGVLYVGISFLRDVVGNFPDKNSDIPYYLFEPRNSSDAPYSMGIILSNEAWVRQVLLKHILAIPELSGLEYTLEKESGFYREMTFKASIFNVPTEDKNYPDPGFEEGGWKYQRQYHSGLNFDAVKLYVNFSGGKISVGVNIDAPVDFSCTFWLGGSGGVGGGGWFTADRPGRVKLNFKKDYPIRLLDNGSLKVEAGAAVEEAEITTDVSVGFNYASKYYVLTKCKNRFIDPIRAAFRSITNALDNAGIEVDLFRLNGLVFRSEDVATPRDGEFADDFALMGDLTPKYSLALTPFENTIAASDTFKYDDLPEDVGEVVWTLRALPNESPKNLGTIVNGLYTPPSASEIEGGYKRVIVTATAGDKKSSALVTVVPASISVYPYFLIAHFDPDEEGEPTPRSVLRGGEIKHDLTWSMAAGSKGTIRKPMDDDDLEIPEDKDVRIYLSPKRVPDAGAIEALVHLDRVEVSAGGLKQSIDIVIPWREAFGHIKAVQTEHGGKRVVKLELWYYDAGQGKELLIEPEELTWAVLRGEGTIDSSTGYYEIQDSEGPYIIVASRETDVERNPVWSYSVIVLSNTVKRAIAVVSDEGEI